MRGETGTATIGTVNLAVPTERASRINRMSSAYAIALGVLAGIVLFFVLQRLGVIDRWLDRLER